MKLALLNESGPQLKTLKANTVSLSDEERAKVMDAGASWHHGKNGKPSPAIKKAVVNGKTYYFSNTHRCYAVAKTLAAAINDYHKTVEPSG